MSFFRGKDKTITILLAVAVLVYSFVQNSVWTTVVRVFNLLVCIPIHEYAHARTALALGDVSQRVRGRLTLLPHKHVTVEGALLILAFGFGYGRPVLVETSAFPPEKRKKYYALTALAGPLSNLLLSLLFLTAGFVSWFRFRNSLLYEIFSYASYINIALAVFNMIPVPPLDGSSLLALVLPDAFYQKLNRHRDKLILVIFALAWILPRYGVNLIGGITEAVFGAFSSLLLRFFG